MITPPKIFQRFLNWFCHPELIEDIEGDLIELFEENVSKSGVRKAKWFFVWDVIKLFRPEMIKSLEGSYRMNTVDLLRIHFKVAVRTSLRKKAYTAINILGLAVGMCACLIIYQYVHFELSYDQFHPKAKNIYRLVQTNVNKATKEGTASVGHALAPESMKVIPEILSYVRVHPQWGSAVIVNPECNKPFEEESVLYVDSNFLSTFSFPLIQGDKKSALSNHHNIVITESVALKYFGSNDVFGKLLKVSNDWGEEVFSVSGVLESIPENSQLQFEFLIPLHHIIKNETYNSFIGSWGYGAFTSYVTLEDGANLEIISKKIGKLEEDMVGELLARFNVKFKTSFQPMLDIHLKSNWRNDMFENNGRLEDVRLFSILALFILIMAWVNSINLSTARAIQRGKEVGIRKVIGAAKRQLISQFLVEAGLINFIAAILAVSIAFCTLPILSEVLGKYMNFSDLYDSGFCIDFSIMVIAGTLASGLYPAILLSSFKPASVFHASRTSQRLVLRKGLIVFQFFTSILLISGTYLVFEQLNFMKKAELGIDMDEILIVKGPITSIQGEEPYLKPQLFKRTIRTHHSVVSVAGSGSIPGRGFSFGTEIHKIGEKWNNREAAYFINGDVDFTKTYDFSFLAGNTFLATPSSNMPAVLINEAATEAYGLGTPVEAIGQQLVVKGEDNDTVQVLGVLENYHWSSLKDAHLPYVLALDKGSCVYFSIRLNSHDFAETLQYLENVYLKIFPGNPFQYFFLDDDFNKHYKSDFQFGKLFAVFSVLAIFIACLGLFALVSFSATLRMKEIGIRKILGAQVGSLMFLLSKEYFHLLLIANILAIPVITYWGQSWLNNYAFKIEIGLSFLLIPGILLLVISIITVGLKAYVTTSANPVDSLRDE